MLQRLSWKIAGFSADK